MARYNGYEGGEAEEEIVAALTKLFAAADDDVAIAIKTKYWPIGSAIEIAEARGYIKQLGLKGWMFTRFRKSETHARDCLKCWHETRRHFDEAWEWYKTGN